VGIAALSSWRAAIVAVVAVVVLIVAVVAFEPVTRHVVASQTVCLGCHDSEVYDSLASPPVSKIHPATPGDDSRPARCVECHVPDGVVPSLFVYTHIVSNTDLFGNWRHRAEGPYHPPVARRAYEVRDAMMAADSAPCRTCHIEAEIEPKRKRGQNAHKRALEKKQTCIECHYDLVHEEVPLRPLSDE
jgi:cytochrome c-type protein NapC